MYERHQSSGRPLHPKLCFSGTIQIKPSLVFLFLGTIEFFLDQNLNIYPPAYGKKYLAADSLDHSCLALKELIFLALVGVV